MGGTTVTDSWRRLGGIGMVRMELLHVSALEDSRDYLLVLREQGGRRLLPITIGGVEARAIAHAANGEHALRPSTHDLLVAVIGRLGASLARVVIHDLRSETFYCQLELDGERGVLEVDCRTSDAVALAVRTESPIFATEDLLGRAAVLPRQRASHSGESVGDPGETAP